MDHQMTDMSKTAPNNFSQGSQNVQDKYVHQLISDVFLITLDPPQNFA